MTFDALLDKLNSRIPRCTPPKEVAEEDDCRTDYDEDYELEEDGDGEEQASFAAKS
jgi:hypothetical protein